LEKNYIIFKSDIFFGFENIILGNIKSNLPKVQKIKKKKKKEKKEKNVIGTYVLWHLQSQMLRDVFHLNVTLTFGICKTCIIYDFQIQQEGLRVFHSMK